MQKKSGHTVSWPKLLTKEEQFLTCNFEHICLAKDNLDDEINQTELEAAINRLKDTTPGDDQIHNCMFRNAPKPFVEAILSFFNSIWKTGKYPDEWKIATIIPILKPIKIGKT